MIPSSPTEPSLESLLSPGGGLSEALFGFESRPEQAEMALAVRDALEEGRPLLVEAGTGVGKSLAYLLPGALWAVRRRRRLAVATYTRALQEQLVQRDLPLVQAVLRKLGLELRYSLLMGSENYLCVQRLERCLSRPQELFGGEGRRLLEGLKQWSCGSETGLRSRLPFPVPDPLWEGICRESELCLGRRGPHWEQCLHRRDVARARQADVTVLNQHLLFAGAPLPEFDAFVFDEAHHLEDAAAQFLGFSLSDRGVRALLDEIRAAAGGGFEQAVERARRAQERFFAELCRALDLDPARRRVEERRARLRAPRPAEDSLSGPLLALGNSLSRAAPSAREPESAAELAALAERCLEAAARVQGFLECGREGYAYWVELRPTRRGSQISMHRAPLDVSEHLGRGLLNGEKPVILTSATLSVRGSFASLRGRLGLRGGAELLLDSPFDYKSQAALYVAEDMPDPRERPQEYEARALERCLEIIPLVPGGVFVLCTSYQFLDKARRGFESRLDGRALLCQGQAPPYELLEEFRRREDAVLLGTNTFWQGVDVPGRALACVVITRLPFLAPDSPLEEARQEWMEAQGQSAFTEYAVPRAVIQFRQGFGRLIRSRSDFGAVALLDPRIETRGYGEAFLRSIPRCRRVANLEELRAFFDSKREEAAQLAAGGGGGV